MPDSPDIQIDLEKILMETGEMDHFVRMVNLRIKPKPAGQEAREKALFEIFDQLKDTSSPE